MTDRDRLIELCENLILSCKSSLCNDCEHNKIDYPHCMSVHFADHLLSNGIIVPPCKVGDKIYKMSVLGEITELKVKGFDCEVIAEPYNSIPFSMLNKTLFLTKEEAENALAERSKGK